MFSCESEKIVILDVFISCVYLSVCVCVCVWCARVFASTYMQVKVNNEVATGTGPNKKVAKRNAAEAMLLQLGYKASTVPQNPTEVRTRLLLLTPTCIFYSQFINMSPTLFIYFSA